MIALATRDLVLLVGLTVIWGANLVVSKIGIELIPPIFFTLLRFSIVAVLLAPWLKVRPGQMSALIVAMLLAGGAHFALMFVGLGLAANVSSVAIASQLGIPFTTLLSVALLGEVVRWRRWTGIVLSFAGVVIMGFDPDVAERWWSLALVAASTFMGSLGLIAIKKLKDFTPVELQSWLAWTSVPVLLGLSVLFERDELPALDAIPPLAWGTVLFSAIIVNVIAQTGFYRLVQRYPVTSVAPLTTLSPLFSILFGMLLLGETLTTRIAIGAACTLIGVLIITLRERRIADVGT